MRKKASVYVVSVFAGILATGCLAFADTCSTGSFTTDGTGQQVCDLGVLPLPVSGETAVINGGTFHVDVASPTGTGVFDPFLRIQETPAEGGWNEDYKNPPDVPAGTDAKSDPHTHSLLLSDLATVACGGDTCFEFTLDLQESAGNTGEFISLNNVQIFVGDSANPSDDHGCDATNFATCLGTLAWNMDGGLDSSVTLNSTIHQGNGTSNMTLFVPTSFFTGLSGNLVFYSQFGNPPGDWGSADSFEEWAALIGENNTPVPEPASLMLLGTGLVAIGGAARRRMKKA